MRKAPLILSGFFIFVTLSRVARFSAAMGDADLSIAFAAGLGITIFIASYWTQYSGNTNPSDAENHKITQAVKFAWVVLIISTLIDGAFNLAHVLHEHALAWDTFIYGIAPTTAALLLGVLQARIDVLPKLRTGSKLSLWPAFTKAVERGLNNFGARAKQLQDELEAAQTKIGRLQETAKQFKPLQKECQDLQAQNKAMQADLESVQFANTVLQGDLLKLQDYAAIVQAMNAKAQAAARYNVGQFANLDEAANAAQCDPSTISRMAKNMNGEM